MLMNGKVDVGTITTFPFDDRVCISLVMIFSLYDRVASVRISVSHAMTERRTDIRMAFELCAHLDTTLLTGTVTEASHERHETTVLARLSQERVLQQLECRRPLLGIAYEHLLNEALKSRRNLHK